MTVHNLSVPPWADEQLAQFAWFLADSTELTEDIVTSVEIEVRKATNVRGLDDGTQSSPSAEGDEAAEASDEASAQYVNVREHGNDGFDLVPEYDDEGHIDGYHSTGTSKVGRYVQDLADEFFGTHSYVCGFYEDEHSSQTTIRP